MTRLEAIEAGVVIEPEFYVNLKGRSYPLWAGILNAATKAGLKSLCTRIAQIPHADNGNIAVVVARAEFEDGSVFEDVGDCGPGSTSPNLLAASLRIASTRAKGRALRDAMNIGEATFEEGDLTDSEAPSHPQPQANGGGRPQGKGVPSGAPVCSVPDCGALLSQRELQDSMKDFNRRLCKTHQQELRRRIAANPAA